MLKKFIDWLHTDKDGTLQTGRYTYQRPDPTTNPPTTREIHNEIKITEKGRAFLSGDLAICRVCGRVLPNIGFEDGVCLDCQH